MDEVLGATLAAGACFPAAAAAAAAFRCSRTCFRVNFSGFGVTAGLTGGALAIIGGSAPTVGLKVAAAATGWGGIGCGGM